MELEKLGYLPKPKGLVIKEQMGKGPCCTVYRGRLDGKPVAVKKLHGNLLDLASLLPETMFDVKRRLIQARNLLSLDHPGIVNIIGAYYDKQTGEPLLVMELMKENLGQYLEVRGHLSVTEQCTMCRDIASALVYLHQQDPPIACFALTSGNILISFDGQVKLDACGVARRKPPGGHFDLDCPGAILYMPPEAVCDDARYDEKINVFSLGVVMTEIATQHPPFSGFENIGIVEEIKRRQFDLSMIPADHPLKPTILHCLQDNPVNRPNIASVLKEIKRICPVSQQEWIEAYQEALEKQGSVSVEVIRCLFIGPPAVGKSSLRHLLVHNESKAVKTSTPVMEAPDVVRVTSEQYAIEEASSNWELVEGDTMTQSVQLSALERQYRSLCKETPKPETLESVPDTRADIQTDVRMSFFQRFLNFFRRMICLARHLETSDPEVENAVSQAANRSTIPPVLKSIPRHGAHTGAQSTKLEDIYEQLIQKDSEAILKSGIVLDNASFIHLLDSGGQPCFLDTLPLLLVVPCTYVLVFNASQDLDQPLPVSYRPDKNTEEILPSTQTGRDLMQRSMSSFHTMGVKHSKEMSHFQEHGAQSSKPSIFLVGTFKDVLQQEGRLPDRCKKISDIIHKTSHLPAFHHIIKDPSGRPFYLVNNNLTTDPDTSSEDFQYINHLRSSLSSSDAALKMEVPLMWYLLQQVTHRSDQRLIRYTELKEFATRHQLVISEQQFSSFVKLFHLLGFFVYFDLPNTPEESQWVCADATFFYREVSKLLSIQFTPVQSEEGNRFKITGIIGPSSQSVLEELHISKEMDPEWLFKSLLHTGIAADIDGSCQHVFIPAALPSQEPPPHTPSVSVLCVSFKIQKDPWSEEYTNLPQGVFCRVVVELAKGQWKVLPTESTRTSVKFLWKNSQILLMECLNRVEVAVTFQEPFLLPQITHEYYSEVHELVKTSMRNVSKKMFGAHNHDISDVMKMIHEYCHEILELVKMSMRKVSKEMFGEHNHDIGDVVVGFQCPCGAPFSHIAQEEHMSVRCVGGEMRDIFQKLSPDQLIWFTPIHTNQAELTLQHHSQLRCYVLKELTPSQQRRSSGGCMDKHLDEALVWILPDLRTGLSLDGVLPRLERPAGGFMTKSEKMQVQSLGSPVESVSEIVGILREKTNDDFYRFLAILDQSGNEHWSTRIREKIYIEFNVKSFTLQHKTEFLNDVNTGEIVGELKRIQVISDKLKNKIECAPTREEANRLLLEHVCDNCDVESLWILCEVMMKEQGYPKMNALGRRMLRDLSTSYIGSSSEIPSFCP